MARLSSGCFYFQRELISSACAGVRFFPPVTESWKTPLNNISKHSWNKDRARGESGNKTRDNQSCCCSLTSLMGGLNSQAKLTRPPAACPVLGLRSALLTPQLGAALEPAPVPGAAGQVWVGQSRLEQVGYQEPGWGKARGKPGAKWAHACTRQGGRHCCRNTGTCYHQGCSSRDALHGAAHSQLLLTKLWFSSPIPAQPSTPQPKIT